MTEAREVAPGFEALSEPVPAPALAAAAAERAQPAKPQVVPFGSWGSPITAELVARAGLRFGELRPTPGGVVYWVEGRPLEGGRNVIMRADAGGIPQDITPAGFNARTRVHEYGGGAFAVHSAAAAQPETLVFVHYGDNRLYRQEVLPDGTAGVPIALTPEDGGLRRYADPCFDTPRGRILAICEDHRPAAGGAPPGEPRNYLVAIALDHGAAGPAGPADPTIVAEGHDFYSSPRLSADGSVLSFLAWDHPSMPWFGCTLYVAAVAPDGTVGEPRPIAGGRDESLFQPEWSPRRGTLYFASDRDTGWWNLYRCPDPLGAATVERVTDPIEAEFAVPQWNLGMCVYDFLPEAAPRGDVLVSAFTRHGRWELALVEPDTRRFTPVAVDPFTDLAQVRASTGSDGRSRVLFVGGGPDTPTSVVRLAFPPAGTAGTVGTPALEVVRSAAPLSEEVRRCLSQPIPITFATNDGPSPGREAHALYYPPYHPDFAAPEGELSPILVKGHGGPTAAASTRLSLGFQYWTSRGIGILDVNYGGSTGYGREFRFRLYRQWGVTDVEDCVRAAGHLVNEGQADSHRLFISGGSAGGYTALRAITFRSGVFAAAASFYGIGDLEALARDTHKFEARYLDWLIGPYPEQQAVYRDRSPINHVDQLSVPVAFFQGSEDRIVPPNQAEMMVEALRGKGIPVGYFLFQGEGHGFRQGPNIVRAADAELYFYSFTALDAGLRF